MLHRVGRQAAAGLFEAGEPGCQGKAVARQPQLSAQVMTMEFDRAGKALQDRSDFLRAFALLDQEGDLSFPEGQLEVVGKEVADKG